MKYSAEYVALLREETEIFKARERKLYKRIKSLHWGLAYVMAIAIMEFIHILKLIN
jgi:hypothetical protein